MIIFPVADHNIDNIHDVEGQLCDDGEDNQDGGDGYNENGDGDDDGDGDDNYIKWW